jgi:hypothetical protein
MSCFALHDQHPHISSASSSPMDSGSYISGSSDSDSEAGFDEDIGGSVGDGQLASSPTSSDESVDHEIDPAVWLADAAANGATLIPPGQFARCGPEVLAGELKVPDGFTRIGATAFKDCTGITSVVLPSTLTAIERLAFWGCSAIAVVASPLNAVDFHETAFFQCE